jgi:hypothetical protein
MLDFQLVTGDRRLGTIRRAVTVRWSVSRHVDGSGGRPTVLSLLEPARAAWSEPPDLSGHG